MAKLTISINENGDLQLEKVYSGVVLVTEDKERFGICMRDTGFEFNYGGKWYEAKGGELRKMTTTVTELETTERESNGVTVVEHKVTVTKSDVLMEENADIDYGINYDDLLNKFGPEGLYNIARKMMSVANKDVNDAINDNTSKS